MPEDPSGRPDAPATRDNQEWIRDTLTQVVDDLAALTCAVADLAKRIGDAEAEAEDILRRAILPAPPRPAPPRRRDTVLRVVRAFVIAVAGVGLLYAAACYTGQAASASPAHAWRLHGRLDADGDPPALPG